ncbi:Uncharacterised protein [Mycobacteroides abscessus subsp. abscessus]|nr:Uncharacterised protein [Mycobacteroides abscessus subsp. abscessus]
MPRDAVIGRSRRLNACAAIPPNSPRARGVRNTRAMADAGRSARGPNAASRKGCRGMLMIGRSRSADRSSNPLATSPKSRRQRRPSSPSAAAVSSID